MYSYSESKSCQRIYTARIARFPSTTDFYVVVRRLCGPDRSYLIRQRWDAIHSLTIVSPEREPQKGGEEEPPTEEMETTA